MIVRGWYGFLYYFSWLLFGLVGLLLNALCALLLLAPRRQHLAPAVRRGVRHLFSAWVKWIHLTGIVRVTWHGFEQPLPRGTVYVANHPSLIDATLILSRLDDALCIFKPALLRHPVTGPAAIMAGYLGGENGVDIIRAAAERVARGQSLLIFPEGTRTTRGVRLNPLRPGFALIVARARAPVQLITLETSEDLVPRGRSWWKLPSVLPGSVRLRMAERIDYDPMRSAAELTTLVEARLQERLRESSRSP